MNIEHSGNTLVLEYLSSGRTDIPPFSARDSHPDPYLRAGSHPDIVERLWDKIGPTLPCDCRGLVYGCPALVVPSTGLIIALGMGTQYGLRLPGLLLEEAIAAGACTTTIWAVNRKMDIQEKLGPEWVFGARLQYEIQWCGCAYEMLSSPA